MTTLMVLSSQSPLSTRVLCHAALLPAAAPLPSNKAGLLYAIHGQPVQRLQVHLWDSGACSRSSQAELCSSCSGARARLKAGKIGLLPLQRPISLCMYHFKWLQACFAFDHYATGSSMTLRRVYDISNESPALLRSACHHHGISATRIVLSRPTDTTRFPGITHTSLCIKRQDQSDGTFERQCLLT